MLAFKRAPGSAHSVPAEGGRNHVSKDYSIHSCDRMSVIRRVTTRGVILELPFNVRQHSTGTKAEEIRVEPAAAELLFDQREPIERLLAPTTPTPRAQPHHT